MTATLAPLPPDRFTMPQVYDHLIKVEQEIEDLVKELQIMHGVAVTVRDKKFKKIPPIKPLYQGTIVLPWVSGRAGASVVLQTSAHVSSQELQEIGTNPGGATNIESQANTADSEKRLEADRLAKLMADSQSNQDDIMSDLGS